MVNMLDGKSKRPFGKPGSLFIVIPDSVYRESIVVSLRMDPAIHRRGRRTQQNEISVSQGRS